MINEVRQVHIFGEKKGNTRVHMFFPAIIIHVNLIETKWLTTFSLQLSAAHATRADKWCNFCNRVYSWKRGKYDPSVLRNFVSCFSFYALKTLCNKVNSVPWFFPFNLKKKLTKLKGFSVIMIKSLTRHHW